MPKQSPPDPANLNQDIIWTAGEQLKRPLSPDKLLSHRICMTTLKWSVSREIALNCFRNLYSVILHGEDQRAAIRRQQRRPVNKACLL